MLLLLYPNYPNAVVTYLHKSPTSEDMYKIFFENMDRISALIQYLGSEDDEERQVARHAQPLPCRNAQHGAAAALARELRQVIHRRTERRSVPRRAEVHQRCAGPGSSAPGTYSARSWTPPGPDGV